MYGNIDGYEKVNAWGKCSPLLGGSSNVVRTLKVAGQMNENSVKHV